MIVAQSNMNSPGNSRQSDQLKPQKHLITAINGGIVNQQSNYYPTEEMELLEINSLSYTSLKDLIPPAAASSAPATPRRKNSDQDVPIRNPLVKQAALAYLSPMTSPPEINPSRRWCLWVRKLLTENCFFKKRLLGFDEDEVEEDEEDKVGCCDLVNDVVLGPVKEVFVKAFGFGGNDDDDDDSCHKGKKSL